MKTFAAIFFAMITAITSFFSTPGAFKELVNKGDIAGFADTVTEYKKAPDFSCDENGDFTVLQFSDTHFTTGLSYTDTRVLRKMQEQTEAYKPDLVVVLGDMINDGDLGAYNKAYVLRTVAEMFDSLEQYWAYIPGNNDGLNYGTSADVTAYLSQYDYCLAADVKEVSGGAQYSLDIYDGETLTHSLVFLDTMDYDDEDSEHIYGYVHADQVEWCEKEIAAKQEINPNVNVSFFMHENTPAFRKAALDGKAYKEGYATISVSAEKYDIPKNQPLDDVFADAGCVGLVSIGHVHPSEAQCSFYNGTYYHITPKTANMSTIVTIHTSAENTENMYDFEVIK